MGLQIDSFFDDGHTLDGDELIVVQGGGNERSHVISASNVIQHVDRIAAAGGKYILVNNHFRASQAPGVTTDARADNYVAKYTKLLAAGLDPMASMRIRSDAFGRLEVVGDDPRAKEIEALLAHDPALSQAFQELVELFQRLHTSAAAPSGSAESDDSPFGLGSWKQTAERKLSPVVEFIIDQESINVSVSG